MALAFSGGVNRSPNVHFFKKIILYSPGPRSQLWPLFDPHCGVWGLSFAASEPLVAACGILFPAQGWNLGPLRWEDGVLAMDHRETSSVCILTSSQVTTLKVLGFYPQHPSLHRNSRDRAFLLQQYKAWAQILHSI